MLLLLLLYLVGSLRYPSANGALSASNQTLRLPSRPAAAAVDATADADADIVMAGWTVRPFPSSAADDAAVPVVAVSTREGVSSGTVDCTLGASMTRRRCALPRKLLTR